MKNYTNYTKEQLEVRIETINTLIATLGDEGKLAKELMEAYRELENRK
jgi:hypothetical protein